MKLFALRLSQYLRHHPKSWWRTLVSQLWFALGRSRVPVLPTYLDAEPTNHCNQECPGCATGDGTLSRPKGMMKLDVWERIMEQVGHSVNFTDLYCMGESFLNKKLYDFIAGAMRRGIFTKIDTNGIIIDPEKVLDSGLRLVNFHISGTDQETHEKYRRGGDLDNIVDNIRRLVEGRRQRQERTGEPGALRIRMGMIVFKQNEHQLDDFFALGKRLEVDEVYLIPGKVPNSNADAMGGMLTTIEDLRVYDEAELGNGRFIRRNRSKCSWPWHGVSVSWNGDVHPCCHDYYDDHKVGNIVEHDIEAIWNGEPLRRFRERLLAADDIPMCRECPGYGVGAAVTTMTKKTPLDGAATRVG